MTGIYEMFLHALELVFESIR